MSCYESATLSADGDGSSVSAVKLVEWSATGAGGTLSSSDAGVVTFVALAMVKRHVPRPAAGEKATLASASAH